MRLAIITHAVHGEDPQGSFAYGPYVREMNLWCTYADEIEVVAPQTLTSFDPIHLHYTSNQLAVTAIP